jgi:hypothetical protein
MEQICLDLLETAKEKIVMDFYVRRGDSVCPFTGKEQKAMVKVITNDETVHTPFLSREVLLEALKILDAACEKSQPQMTQQILTEPSPYLQGLPSGTVLYPIVSNQVPQGIHSHTEAPKVSTQPQPPQVQLPQVKKNPGGLTDQEVEVAKEFASELIELIENPPADPKGRQRDGIMNSDLKELYLKYASSFRNPIKALYPILKTHVIGFQESQMSSW